MFFLRYLDLIEQEEQTKAAALGVPFRETLASPYRWHDWAAKAPRDKDAQDGSHTGWKRQELTESAMGDFLKFVNDALFPYLKALKDQPGATNKQKVTSEIFISKEKTVVASETNLLNALDKVHELTSADISDRHMFPISQAFEGLLPSLGEKKNDGGQFFTPREVIRVIVNAVNPQLGKTVYDPCCGTGGFLIEAYKHMMGQNPVAKQIKEL
jgi:type I restriction enzyme M protein